jgi:hypothetical protein
MDKADMGWQDISVNGLLPVAVIMAMAFYSLME